MPRVRVNGAELHYEDTGDGPETVVMAHGLLLSGRMFDGVVAGLRDRYRCVTFDFRGQGASPVVAARYDLDVLTEDAAGLIRALGCGPCHFLGFSMGGFVGMRLAVRHPELVRSLVLVGTSASHEPRRLRYRLFGLCARAFGVRAVTPLVMPVQFGRRFLRAPARAAERREWFDRIAATDLQGGLLASAAVIGREDFSAQLDKIRQPALVMVGEDDRATPPDEARRLRSALPGSDFVIVPGAGHALPIEEAVATANAVGDFLSKHALGSGNRPTTERRQAL